MISSLRGKLVEIGNDWVVVDVNGVGFNVYSSTSTLATLGVTGDEVHLYTHLHFREDNIALFGFSTFEELNLFRILITVSGVGPKLATAMLSAVRPDRLVSAITGGDIDTLTTVPGIGKKTAGRLVLELKDKINAGLIPVTVQISQNNSEVVSVLTSLGYSVAEANRAVATIPPATINLEEKIKLALAYFARK
jgi:Holliday junction DNA helicase RuvA